jgi:hypothetical protein
MCGARQPRIGFLFNHRPDEVWHAAPIAFELSRLNPDAEILILCVDEANLATVKRIAAGYPGQNCHMELARIASLMRALAAMFRGFFPLLKEVALHRNARCFAGFDALIVPDLGSLRLKRRLPGVRMIRVRHGAGDRADSFDDRNAAFDFLLLPGRKYERRLKAAKLLHDDGYAIVGYPKFDAVDRTAGVPTPVFDNGRPTVLYNPHFDCGISSWRSCGLDVLDFFVRHEDRYNLIFAPHLKLFEQWLRRCAYLPRRYRHRPNIHADLGSPASADMTYTRAADIYLGDVSSQVYEFLRQPRPCVFIDPRGLAWEHDPNYAHWHFGPVIRDPAQLGPALERAVAEHFRYKAKQEYAFNDTFELTATPSAERAARAILDFIAR